MATSVKILLYVCLAGINFFLVDSVVEMFSNEPISTETRIIIGLFSPALALGEIIAFNKLFSR